MDFIAALEFHPNYFVTQLVGNAREIVLGIFASEGDAREFAKMESKSYRGITFTVRDANSYEVAAFHEPFGSVTE